MTLVALMACCVGLVDARALSEGCESGLIHSFVDVEPTYHTFQVASGLGGADLRWAVPVGSPKAP